MNPETHNNNSDTSTAESDQPEKPTEDTSAGGGGRSYDCTFCKRGFTNAQALGGHMNIHRKDKAKAKSKQKNQQEHPWIRNFESSGKYKNLSYFSQISSDYCDPGLGGCVNYQVYFPTSNHGIQSGNYLYDNCLKDDMDGNLSLRIGLCPPVEDGGEVDLELRLGQYTRH